MKKIILFLVCVFSIICLASCDQMNELIKERDYSIVLENPTDSNINVTFSCTDRDSSGKGLFDTFSRTIPPHTEFTMTIKSRYYSESGIHASVTHNYGGRHTSFYVTFTESGENRYNITTNTI